MYMKSTLHKFLKKPGLSSRIEQYMWNVLKMYSFGLPGSCIKPLSYKVFVHTWFTWFLVFRFHCYGFWKFLSQSYISVNFAPSSHRLTFMVYNNNTLSLCIFHGVHFVLMLWKINTLKATVFCIVTRFSLPCVSLRLLFVLPFLQKIHWW
jgi:hypothetical protein